VFRRRGGGKKEPNASSISEVWVDAPAREVRVWSPMSFKRLAERGDETANLLLKTKLGYRLSALEGRSTKGVLDVIWIGRRGTHDDCTQDMTDRT